MKIDIYLFFVGLLLIAFPVRSQHAETPTAAWLLPGIGYKHSQDIQLLAQYGANKHLDAEAIYVQGFFGMSKYVIINPAYLYLDFSPRGAPQRHEHTFLNAVIFKVQLQQFTIEDRNLIWNRLRKEEEDLMYYRNRLKINWAPVKKNASFKLYLFDEAWYFFTDHRWSRNRIAAGAVYNITTWLQTDASFTLEHDHYNGRTNIFFIQTILQLRSKKMKQIVN